MRYLVHTAAWLTMLMLLLLMFDILAIAVRTTRVPQPPGHRGSEKNINALDKLCASVSYG